MYAAARMLATEPQRNLNDVDQLMTLAPYIRFPHLKYIQIEYARVWTAISLLDHIYPAPGCALNFSIRGDEIPTEERVGEIQRVTSRYTEIYYGLGIATTFHLRMSSNGFSITDPDLVPRIRLMSISCASPRFIVADFLCVLTGAGFSNVNYLLLLTNSNCADDNKTYLRLELHLR